MHDDNIFLHKHSYHLYFIGKRALLLCQAASISLSPFSHIMQNRASYYSQFLDLWRRSIWHVVHNQHLWDLYQGSCRFSCICLDYILTFYGFSASIGQCNTPGIVPLYNFSPLLLSIYAILVPWNRVECFQHWKGQGWAQEWVRCWISSISELTPGFSPQPHIFAMSAMYILLALLF